jgi:hypothetical protein
MYRGVKDGGPPGESFWRRVRRRVVQEVIRWGGGCESWLLIRTVLDGKG